MSIVPTGIMAHSAIAGLMTVPITDHIATPITGHMDLPRLAGGMVDPAIVEALAVGVRARAPVEAREVRAEAQEVLVEARAVGVKAREVRVEARVDGGPFHLRLLTDLMVDLTVDRIVDRLADLMAVRIMGTRQYSLEQFGLRNYV